MATKTLIFDVDGTLADSFAVFVESFTTVLGRAPLSTEEIEDLRGLTVKQLLKRLHIRFWQLPKIVRRGRAEVTRNYSAVELFPGIAETIHQLYDRGAKLHIVSTNSATAVHGLLQRHGLDDCFISVQGDIGLGGKAKRLKKLATSDCFYIGDEVRDMLAAKAAGMPAVAVAWGFNTVTALEAVQPAKLLRHPVELLQLLD